MEHPRPLVSIITPSYNQGRYIEETILSVLNQDYPHLEYLVIDGGSTDNTVEVLKKYEHRLVWISEKDNGQADAVNKGFRLARGKILGWLNSDDTYLPGAIAKSVAYLQEHPDTALVYGEGYHIDGAGKIIDRYPTEPLDVRRLHETCFICQPTVFFRTSVLREVGFLDESLQYCMDYDYWVRVAQRCRIGYLSEYLATSRLHEEGKTFAYWREAHEELFRVLKRYYGTVSSLWLYDYARLYMREKVAPLLGLSHAWNWRRVATESEAEPLWRRVLTRAALHAVFLWICLRVNHCLPRIVMRYWGHRARQALKWV